MDNTNNDNDIDALQAALMEAREECVWFISPEQANDFSRVLSALLLERDALKAECNKRFDSVTIKDLLAERDALLKRVAELQEVNRTAVSIISQRDALTQRVAELEKELKSRNEAYEELRWRSVEKSWSQPPPDRDRELRERLVCAALTGLCADPSFDGIVVQSAIALADEAIAAMRKGAANG